MTGGYRGDGGQQGHIQTLHTTLLDHLSFGLGKKQDYMIVIYFKINLHNQDDIMYVVVILALIFRDAS